MPVRAYFSAGDFDPLIGQADSVFGVRSGFISRSVRSRLYKSLCAAVTICAALTHTDAQTAFD